MSLGRWVLLSVVLVANLLVVVALLARFSYAPLPSLKRVANAERNASEGVYDVLGRTVTQKEARELLATEGGARELSPRVGAVPITGKLVQDGRAVFYRETFGNEHFLTDVLGMLDGGISAWAITKALLGVAGRGTNDLKVRLVKDVQVGDDLFREGTLVSTGLDVPKGGFFPLGIRVFYDRGRVRAGITCAVCHSTVDPDSGLVLEGAPNTNFNAGLVLALASNSAAYYQHTSVDSLDRYLDERSRAVADSRGIYAQIPDPERFERVVSGQLALWPPGFFDSTIDGVNNPTSIPDSFTAHDEPFGWSGFAAIGPFRGLSALNNNVHALNSDETALAELLALLGRADPEVYLAVLLQNAAHPAYRFHAEGDRKPSEVLAQATPTPLAPGVNRFAVLPSFPRPNFFTTNSLITVREAEPIGYAINAMSAFQNSLKAPSRYALNAEGIQRGREVFQAAGCARCHDGAGFTNHRVLPASEVGAEPSRARALRDLADIAVAPLLFAPDTPYPPPLDALLLPIPLQPSDREQLRLGWAQDGKGGYKVKGLVGLEWTAPYLHDGGVAVGPDAAEHLGIPGTLGRGLLPEPRNSLRALFDRGLRARVVRANRASPALVAAHIVGRGHEHWVDEASGYSALDQQALLDYLLSLREISLQGFRGVEH
jgi:hypothetical protein